MNLDELRRVKNRERETDSLQELRDSFYADVAEYIRERKAEREELAEAVDDPFSSEDISRLSDEIETAERVVESLYERRVGKVVKQASFAAAGMGSTASENLTTEERDLYGDLVGRIGENKQRVLDVIGGSASPPDTGETTDADPAPTDAEPAVDAADLMGDGAPADEAPEPAAETPESDAEQPSSSATDTGAGVDRETVRITTDVGEIFGVDERTYELATDDVVTLPAKNASPLVERDAAERLD